jgi:hypothetical protein
VAFFTNEHRLLVVFFERCVALMSHKPKKTENPAGGRWQQQQQQQQRSKNKRAFTS